MLQSERAQLARHLVHITSSAPCRWPCALPSCASGTRASRRTRSRSRGSVTGRPLCRASRTCPPSWHLRRVRCGHARPRQVLPSYPAPAGRLLMLLDVRGLTKRPRRRPSVAEAMAAPPSPALASAQIPSAAEQASGDWQPHRSAGSPRAALTPQQHLEGELNGDLAGSPAGVTPVQHLRASRSSRGAAGGRESSEWRQAEQGQLGSLFDPAVPLPALAPHPPGRVHRGGGGVRTQHRHS